MAKIIWGCLISDVMTLSGLTLDCLTADATKYDFQPKDDHCTVFSDPDTSAFRLSPAGKPSWDLTAGPWATLRSGGR